MAILQELGFKIFRVKENRSDEEFLLYNIKTNTYNSYSEKRAVDILSDELTARDFDIIEFLKSSTNTEDIKVSPKKVLRQWFNKEKILIDKIGYKPVDEITFNEDEKIHFNTYRKSKLLSNYTYKKKDFKDLTFPNIKKLILNLVGNDERDYNYFVSWIAWQVKNPLKRLPTSIILQGEHGTGKTKFCELILKNIFGNNFCEIGQSDINKEYNDYILGKQLIVANEVIHNDNKFLVPDKLKNFVTDQYLSINRKFKDTLYVKNYAQWIFVTNNSNPLKIETGDRRYSVFKSKKLVNGFDLIDNLLNNLNEELTNFITYLLSINIDYSYISTPINNKAKTDIIRANWNSVQEFIGESYEREGIDNLAKQYYGSEFIHESLEIINQNDKLYVCTHNLYKLYVLFCRVNGLKPFARINFTRELKNLGFDDGVQRIEDKPHRVIYLQKNE